MTREHARDKYHDEQHHVVVCLRVITKYIFTISHCILFIRYIPIVLMVEALSQVMTYPGQCPCIRPIAFPGVKYALELALIYRLAFHSMVDLSLNDDFLWGRLVGRFSAFNDDFQWRSGSTAVSIREA